MIEFINSSILKIILFFFLLLFLLGFLFSDQIVNFTLTYILLYKYTTIFVITFLAGFCLPIPNNILLMAVGALSLEAQFQFWYCLPIAVIANVIGDIMAMLIFRKWGHEILRDQFVAKYPFFLRLEEFFQRHRNTSLVVSRVIGFFGQPVNFLSGYLKIPISKFAIWDSVGNFIYVLLFLSIGHWAGDRWLAVSDFVSAALGIIAALLFVSIVTLLYKTSKKAG